jgi:hypothetical protein
MALVHERTIPTERPQLVGEVSANLCGWRMSSGRRNGSPQPYSLISSPEQLERGLLSLVSTIEELLGRQISGSGLESREYGRRYPSI